MSAAAATTAVRHQWMPESVYATALTSETPQSYESLRQPYDLITLDGVVAGDVERPMHNQAKLTVSFSNIHPTFHGLHGTPAEFNLKSTLTQLGVNVSGTPDVSIDAAARSATVTVALVATAPLGILLLDVLAVGAHIGKLVSFPTNRRVTSMEYIPRLKDVKDMHRKPVFAVGGDAPIELIDGRVVVKVPLHPGVVTYEQDMSGVLPTVGKALVSGTKVKSVLKLHRSVDAKRTALGTASNFLMVRSVTLSMATLFGRVCDDLLPKGLKCASSNVIEPSTEMSREDRHFVFVGEAAEPLTHIPVELYTVECFREHLPASLRKRLPERAESPAHLEAAFKSMPDGDRPACAFLSKGGIFDKLQGSDWVVADPVKTEGHATMQESQSRLDQAHKYLHQQAEYPVLTAMSVGDITSDGVMLTKYFPSPILKSLMLSREVVGRLKAVVFTRVSKSYGGFFSQEDRATLIDLTNFGIKVYHLERGDGTAEPQLLMFMRRGDSGLFVPLDRREDFANATFFGVYGSNLVEGDFEGELRKLLQGVLEVRKTADHPLLNPTKPLALVTGGGPGAMEVGNRVAKQLGLLSCGMFVDFGSLSRKPGSNINEQKKNPYVEAYMSYRPEKLVERQSEFGLDFPIFLTGGVGTDFEYALEEVRRKVGTVAITPMVLFGTEEHFMNKIGKRFLENRACGTIKGSEWLSNVPYVVTSGEAALEVYRRFFAKTLAIGGKAAANDRGFVLVDDAWAADKSA
jgi:predicted Rossmann-fold nucleotide-binding protein